MSRTSDYKKFLVTNFAYGTGPYLRTTDLAIAFNDFLEKAGHQRLRIIVPLVYGEKQIQIMTEEFGGFDREHPGEILFDEKLGAILRSVFYADSSYSAALGNWTRDFKEVSKNARDHLQGRLLLKTLSGKQIILQGKDIVLELNRSPRIRYDVAPSYFTSFAYIGEILEKSRIVKKEAIDLRSDLLEAGIQSANYAEERHKLHAISYPATFSYAKGYRGRFPGEIVVPPIGPVPKPNNDKIEPGIFVTITGIPGLERLYAEAKKLGLKLYSNDPKAVPGSIKALPEIIPNKNIVFQFARSGWSSVWLSMIAGVPFVAPDFDPADDPEIYWNNRALEEMGIGIIYRDQPLAELLKMSDKVRENQRKLCAQILKKWGTLNGTHFVAEIFVKDFLKSKI